MGALITLIFFLGIVSFAIWLAYSSLNGAYIDSGHDTPRPTPTPEPGTFNIDDKLDMLN